MEYTKLDPTFKAQWLSDLRSGEYPQTRLVYVNNLGFCCLGVAMLQGILTRRSDLYNNQCAYEQAVEDINKKIDVVARDALIKMNDLEKKTFLEIADWIEENL